MADTKSAEVQGITPEQREYIQKNFRIPVDSFNPGRGWIVSLDSDSVLPTDEELGQIVSFRDYLIKKMYNEWFAEKLLRMPLPEDSNHCPTIFCKRAGKAWFYRRRNWPPNSNPLYQPDTSETSYHPLSLVEIMDWHERMPLSVEPLPPTLEEKFIARTHSEEWTTWKKERPDIFPASQPVHVE